MVMKNEQKPGRNRLKRTVLGAAGIWDFPESSSRPGDQIFNPPTRIKTQLEPAFDP